MIMIGRMLVNELGFAFLWQELGVGEEKDNKNDTLGPSFLFSLWLGLLLHVSGLRLFLYNAALHILVQYRCASFPLSNGRFIFSLVVKY